MCQSPQEQVAHCKMGATQSAHLVVLEFEIDENFLAYLIVVVS